MSDSSDDRSALNPRGYGLDPDEDPLQFLGSLLQAMPAYISRVTPDLRIRYLSRTQEGYNAQDVIGARILDFIAERDQAHAKECMESVQRTGQPASYDVEAAGPRGEVAYYSNYVSAVREPDGRVGLCVVAVDVTARRLQEARARATDEQLKLAIEATGIGLWSWNLDTGDVLWNEQMYQIHGVSEPLPLDRYLDEVVHPDDRAQLRDRSERSLARGVYEESLYRVVRPDGDVRYVLSNGRIENDAAGTPIRIAGGTLDVTERQSMEERFRSVQKMESIGSLTAGVAHNFNNMLMVLLPTLEIVSEVVPPAYQPIVEDARVVGDRAADMVRQLMTFAGQRGSSSKAPVPINAVVQDAFEDCQGSLTEPIRMELVLPPDEPFVLANADEIGQVFLNVLHNARDALVDASTEQPHITVRVVPIENESLEPAVRVVVQDNGPGMTEEVHARIFEPFFTTARAQRAGLGLATAFAIVREHEGWITAKSDPGRGATFTITLPLVAGHD